MSAATQSPATATKLEELALADYQIFISEIFRRLDAISASLSELNANPTHSDSWKNCDFCWFQMRKICEYLTVGIVLAHHCDTGAIADLGKWRPKDLLAQASKLSNHPTPVQISPFFGSGPEGEKQIEPLARPIRPDLISSVYGRCSELLHVGSLERILAGKLPSYDVSQMEAWLIGFRKLLSDHVVLLPGVQKIIVSLTGPTQTSTFILASEGAGFDTSKLADFEF